MRDKEEKALLEKWFKCDMNAVPPMYVLQPISYHIPNSLTVTMLIGGKSLCRIGVRFFLRFRTFSDEKQKSCMELQVLANCTSISCRVRNLYGQVDDKRRLSANSTFLKGILQIEKGLKEQKS